MPSTDQPQVRLRDHRPEMANLWVRHTAILTAPDELVWTDVAERRLGGLDASSEGSGRIGRPSDLVYLPPAADEQRQGMVRDRCQALGIPMLVHHLVGSREPPPVEEGSVTALDLLATLLQGNLDELDSLPEEGVVVWPVLPGLTDEPELLADGLDRVRARELRWVVPVAVGLSPVAGRRLTDAFGERLFDKLFHAREADPRPVARAVLDHGLDFLPPRPSLDGAVPSNRRVATELATIGELSATADSPAAAQDFFRAAAWLESTRHDVGALAREGNLGVVPALSGAVAAVVDEVLGGAERSRLLDESVRRYTMSDT